MVKQTLYSGGLIYDGLHQVLEEHSVLVEGEHIREVAQLAILKALLEKELISLEEPSCQG